MRECQCVCLCRRQQRRALTVCHFFVFVFILKRHPTGIFSGSSYSQFISSLFGCGRKVVQRCKWMCMLSVSCWLYSLMHSVVRLKVGCHRKRGLNVNTLVDWMVCLQKRIMERHATTGNAFIVTGKWEARLSLMRRLGFIWAETRCCVMEWFQTFASEHQPVWRVVLLR